MWVGRKTSLGMSSKLLRVGSWEQVAREAKFSPALMAALCSISLRQMERHFSIRFHKSPQAWLKELRCRIAKELIEGGYSSRAVVEELGFKDHSHLCHQFKQVYGGAPQTFSPSYRPGAPEP